MKKTKVDLKKNQNKSGYGGKRAGAGRKKGKTGKARAHIKEIIETTITDADIKKRLKLMWESAEAKDTQLIFEYLYGKPTQPINNSGEQTIIVTHEGVDNDNID